MRFDTNFRAAKARLDAGEIGSPRMLRISGLTAGYDMGHKTWIGDPANGGALLDWGSHGFDILRFVAGADPVRLSAELADFGGAPVGEPSAMVQLAYANGVMAQLWMSYELPSPGLDSAFRLWIVGETGILQVNRFGQTLLGHGDSWEVISDDPLPDWSIERRHDPVRVVAPARQIQDWVDALREGRPSAAPAEAGRWAVMQVEAAYRSWHGGETVPLAGSRRRHPPRPPRPIPSSPAIRLESPHNLPLIVEHDVRVPMRDGVELATDVYRPDDAPPHPCSCTGRRPAGRPCPIAPGRSVALVEAGYVIVSQDCRGRFGSAGTFTPFVDEAADGVDAIAWCAAQPWSNGRVGMIGGSYVGATQWLPAGSARRP